jgi:hypothetical protein
MFADALLQQTPREFQPKPAAKINSNSLVAAGISASVQTNPLTQSVALGWPESIQLRRARALHGALGSLKATIASRQSTHFLVLFMLMSIISIF